MAEDPRIIVDDGLHYRYVRFDERHAIEAHHPELARSDKSEADLPIACEGLDTPDEMPILLYVLDTQSGKVVARRRMLPDAAVIGGVSYPWAWGYDTIVDKECRGRKIGGKILDFQNTIFDELKFSTAAAFSAPRMMTIYKKRAYNIVGFCPRMTLAKRAGPFIKNRLGDNLPGSLLGKMLAPLGDLAMSAKLALKVSLASLPSVVLKEIPQADLPGLYHDPNAANSDAQNPQRAGAHWAKKPSWISERLGDGDRVFTVAASEDAPVSAMFVLRKRAMPDDPGEAQAERISVMYYDRFCEAEIAADHIAAGLVQFARGEAFDALDFVCSDLTINAKLAKTGFVPRGDGMTYVFRDALGQLVGAPTNLEGWHLTHFCSDGFLFP